MLNHSAWKFRVAVGLTAMLVSLLLYRHVVRPVLISQLVDSARAGKLDRVRASLALLDPNVRGDRCVTPLIAAARGFPERNDDVLELLIASGAGLNLSDRMTGWADLPVPGEARDETDEGEALFRRRPVGNTAYAFTAKGELAQKQRFVPAVAQVCQCF